MFPKQKQNMALSILYHDESIYYNNKIQTKNLLFENHS